MKNRNEEKLYFGISDATSASAVLDVAIDESYPIELLVAADVISKVDSSEYFDDSLLSSVKLHIILNLIRCNLCT